MKSIRMISIFAVLAMLLAACAPAATPTPAPTEAQAAAATTAPAAPAATDTVAPTAAPTAEPATATPAATATAAEPTPVASIPAENLVQKNHLLVCTDFPYPPQEFFNENGDPQGLDVEIGTEIAARLGLKVQFVNSVFDTIIAAVTSGKCDIIISAMNITTERQKKVSMIPYFKAGQAFVVQKGNPKGIKETLDFCGQSVAAESGTTEADYLQGANDYKGKGLPADCKAAGKEAPTVVVTQKDTDALQQLQTGKVVAYASDSPVAAYYTVQHPNDFELAGSIVESVPEGINMSCGLEDCTNAPLTPVGTAVDAALKSMFADGTYAKILAKWNLTNSSVAP
jgi:polar amino acid transport system substrate-binding protein